MRQQKSRSRIWIVGFFLLLVVVGGAYFFLKRFTGGSEAREEAWFEDVTDAVGLDFVHDVGDVSKGALPQINGSGVAVFDFDGDGRLDVYLLNFGGPGSKSINRLFKNMPDGTFKDVT